MRRQFTLQLYDRIEPRLVPGVDPTGNPQLSWAPSPSDNIVEDLERFRREVRANR